MTAAERSAAIEEAREVIDLYTSGSYSSDGLIQIRWTVLRDVLLAAEEWRGESEGMKDLYIKRDEWIERVRVQVLAERDEARAEVERLRYALRTGCSLAEVHGADCPIRIVAQTPRKKS